METTDSRSRGYITTLFGVLVGAWMPIGVIYLVAREAGRDAEGFEGLGIFFIALAASALAVLVGGTLGIWAALRSRGHAVAGATAGLYVLACIAATGALYVAAVVLPAGAGGLLLLFAVHPLAALGARRGALSLVNRRAGESDGSSDIV